MHLIKDFISVDGAERSALTKLAEQERRGLDHLGQLRLTSAQLTGPEPNTASEVAHEQR